MSTDGITVLQLKYGSNFTKAVLNYDEDFDILVISNRNSNNGATN